jgi:hypothetical protein|tara:strand:- start:125 stop:373 length:249 start_codon:yes stop_codon:yes gene_type:complete
MTRPITLPRLKKMILAMPEEKKIETIERFMRTGPMMIKAETEEARGVHFNPKCLKRAKNVYKMILDLWITEVDDMYRIDYEK